MEILHVWHDFLDILRPLEAEVLVYLEGPQSTTKAMDRIYGGL